MLNKLLGAAKLTRLFQWGRQKKKLGAGAGARAGCLSPPLKIVLPGGVVELYYVAVPAAKIMEAHPSFMVARPEVFRRPWDSLVHPDEILNPGEKYFLVPRSTVRKLRRRIRKPDGDFPGNSFSSQSSASPSSSGTASPLVVVNEASYPSDTETQQGREGREQSQQGMRRVRNIISWRPSLTAITE